MYWTQIYDPLGHWWLSTLVAALPILVLFSLLAGLKVKPHWCAIAGAMTAVIVASRREVAPFGLEGGEDAAVGRQWVERADGRRENLSGTDSAELAAGDVFVIETPGGGGYGVAT